MRTSIALGQGASAPPSRMGRLLGLIMRNPANSLGWTAASAIATAIIVNALYLQSGQHPAPLVGAPPPGAAKDTTGSLASRAPTVPVTRVATSQAEPQQRRNQIITTIQQELAERGFYDAGIDGVYGPKMDAGIREFEQAAGLPIRGEPTEALLKALQVSKLRAKRADASVIPVSAKLDTRTVPTPPSRRIMAVQRALTDFGYGQLRLSGIFDEPTKLAIEKFERERRLPVRGQISGRLIRELAAVTGRPLE